MVSQSINVSTEAPAGRRDRASPSPPQPGRAQAEMPTQRKGELAGPKPQRGDFSERDRQRREEDMLSQEKSLCKGSDTTKLVTLEN